MFTDFLHAMTYMQKAYFSLLKFACLNNLYTPEMNFSVLSVIHRQPFSSVQIDKPRGDSLAFYRGMMALDPIPSMKFVS